MIKEKDIQNKIDSKTKPLGALGMLEAIALKICKVQNTLNPKLIEPHILVVAADHGIAEEGVSAYPQDVTWQMVYNFLKEGAAINVFAKQHNINVLVVDAGVKKELKAHTKLIDARVANGTANFLYKPAITEPELTIAKNHAEKIINDISSSTSCNVFGFGEMGIGNTSSAALIIHCLTGIALKDCIGRGTGLNDEQYSKKIDILTHALNKHKLDKRNVLEVLHYFGGFEIATICFAMIACYNQNKLILVDGFIASAAFLCANKFEPKIIDNAIFCHQSNENGHKYLLAYFKATPLINLNMRLGEGTGCAIAYPIIKSAVEFINNMASFESAGVSNKEVELA